MATCRGRYVPGDEPLPGYRLIKFLGGGNFGKVWQATAPGNVPVALKIVDLTATGGFRELDALEQVKRCTDASLLTISAYWVKDDRGNVVQSAGTEPRDEESSLPVELIIQMPLATGSLYDELKQCKGRGERGIPGDLLIRYMQDAARGIDFLNELGIVHADIKPQNLLRVGRGVQVGDFGLARNIQNLRTTATGMGTVAYAAPELLTGHPCSASDQYCLAISYLELRTGSLPFDCSNVTAVIDIHRSGEIDLSGLPPDEQEVIQKALSLDPHERYPDCERMVAALSRAVALAPPEPVLCGTMAPAPAYPQVTGSTPTATLPRPEHDSDDQINKATQPPGMGPTKPFLAAEQPGLQAPPRRSLLNRFVRILLALSALAAVALLGWIIGADPIGKYREAWVLEGEREAKANHWDELAGRVAHAPWLIRHGDIQRLQISASPQWKTYIRSRLAKGDYHAVAGELRTKSAALAPESGNELWSEARQSWIAGLPKLPVEDAVLQLKAPPFDPERGEIAQQDLDQVAAGVFEVWASRPRSLVENADFAKAVEALTAWPSGLLPREFSALAGDIDRALAAAFRARPADEHCLAAIESLGKLKTEPWVQTRAAVKEILSGRLSAHAFEGDPPLGRLLELLGDAGLTLKFREELETRQKWDRQVRQLAERSTRGDGAAAVLGSSMIDKLVFEDGSPLPLEVDDAYQRQLRALLQMPPDSLAEAKKKLGEIRALAAAPKFPDDPAGPTLQACRAEVGEVLKLLDGKDASMAAEANRWLAVFDLCDAAADPATFQQALRLIGDFVTAEPAPECFPDRIVLARAVGRAAGSETADHRLAARALLEIARTISFPPDKSAAYELARLVAEKRVAQRIREDSEPADEDSKELEEYRQIWAQVPSYSWLIDAWQAEVLAAKGDYGGEEYKKAWGKIVEAGEISEEFAGYRSYVLAQGYRHFTKWSELGPEVSKSLAGTPPWRTKHRSIRLAEWSADWAAEVREKPKRNIDERLDQLFVEPPYGDLDVETVYRVLKQAKDGCPGAAEEAAAMAVSRLAPHLAIAAARKGEPDWETARVLTGELIQPATEINDLDLLWAAIASRRAQPAAEPKTLVAACQRLLELLSDPDQCQGFLKEQEDADRLWTAAIQPAVDVADGSGMDLARFYGVLGDFVWRNHRLQWPSDPLTLGPNRAAECFRQALKHDPGNNPEWRADRLLNLAEALAWTGEERFDEVRPILEEANRLLAKPGGDHRVERLFSRLYLNQARQGDSLPACLESFQKAIDYGRRAVQTAPADLGAAVADAWIDLGSACVEKANFIRDPTFHEQRALLQEALRCADEAKKFPDRDAPDHAFLLEGNAYEDLAWLVEVEPEKNFKNAITAFTAAEDQRLFFADQARLGRARCYYKAVCDTALDPPFLEMTLDEALDESRKTLAAIDSKDACQVDALQYLAAIQRRRGNHASADALLEQARQMATDLRLPSRGFVVAAWVGDPTWFLLFDEAERIRRKSEILSRVEQLEAEDIPPAMSWNPRLEAARITAAVSLHMEPGGATRAIEICGEHLPEPVAGCDVSHVGLLLMRAESRKGLMMQPSLDEDAKITLAEQVVADADAAWELAYLRGDLANASCLGATGRFQLYMSRNDSPQLDEAEQRIRLACDLSPRRNADIWELGDIVVTELANQLGTVGDERAALRVVQHRSEAVRRRLEYCKVAGLGEPDQDRRLASHRQKGEQALAKSFEILLGLATGGQPPTEDGRALCKIVLPWLQQQIAATNPPSEKRRLQDSYNRINDYAGKR